MEKFEFNPPTAGSAKLRKQSRAQPVTRPAALARLAHKIINQITVVGLAGYRLHARTRTTDPGLEADFARLQNALDEMRKSAEVLSRLAEQSRLLADGEKASTAPMHCCECGMENFFEL